MVSKSHAFGHARHSELLYPARESRDSRSVLNGALIYSVPYSADDSAGVLLLATLLPSISAALASLASLQKIMYLRASVESKIMDSSALIPLGGECICVPYRLYDNFE